MRISFNEKALAEAEDAARWYRENGGAVPARAFTQELRRVVELAAMQPGLGAPGLRGTTKLFFKRFPYTLFFRIQESSIRVVAIAHQSRRPTYWAARL